jgi:plastocyanin
VRIRTLIGSALVVTAVLGLTACGGGEDKNEPTTPPTATATTAAPTAAPTATVSADDGGNGGNGGVTGEVISVGLGENPYEFAPAGFTFDSGTTYTLSFSPPNEFHTFTVVDLGIDIFINPGEALEEVITPSTVGEFTLTCIPHEGFGMVGTVTVQ